MASKESDGTPQPATSTLYSTAAGRLVPSINARLPPPGLHTSPYTRTHEFYRSLYGPAATGSAPPESLLESYTRSLGAGLVVSTHSTNSAISPNITGGGLSRPPISSIASSSSGLPLGLTTTNSSSRLSPSSTSSISSGSETPLKPVALNKA